MPTPGIPSTGYRRWVFPTSVGDNYNTFRAQRHDEAADLRCNHFFLRECIALSEMGGPPEKPLRLGNCWKGVLEYAGTRREHRELSQTTISSAPSVTERSLGYNLRCELPSSTRWVFALWI